ncbi:hypothetical protein [Winogradskyella wichelsiae]|uniref:hypothetical protein n=1 Tax=Winogradskyella wichelsiae TaxID=2697007 RepID=UPI0015CD72CE|nr:hypothetical protein [Winogradskyella wichelsiae]
MKKKIFGLMAVVMLVGSSMNLNAYQNNNKSEDQASCFEQGVYFAQWLTSTSGGTAIDRVQIALAYQDWCENL